MLFGEAETETNHGRDDWEPGCDPCQISDSHGLGSDKLRFEMRLPILKQHGYHLAKIRLQFIERLALRVGPREAGHETNKEPGFGTLFHNRGEGMR